MKALAYHGAKDVRVDTVPDPTIVAPTDILLRVTATAICGSDLHLYRGKVPGMKDGDVLGHEFMGIVEDVGKNVKSLRKGDRVVVPFTISCGQCFFCERQLFAACENTNPDGGTLVMNRKNLRPGAGMFGYTHLYGGYDGGQAELVRVPHGDVGPLKLPENTLSDEQVLFLSDILPTGYQAVINTGVGQGSSLAIFGAGPVGVMAAACARMLGVERLFVVDHHRYRLEFVRETYGAIPIDFDERDDPAALIIESMDGRGVDAAIDAVGFEAKGSLVDTALATAKIEGGSGEVLRQAIACTRRGGTVSIPGVYSGWIHAFQLGDAFDKGLTFKMGQTSVQQHMATLLGCIERGELEPDALITHRMPLSRAAEGYKIFDEKQEDCRKVVLTPD